MTRLALRHRVRPVLLLLAAAVVAAFLLRGDSRDDPRVRGRRVSDWFRQLARRGTELEADRLNASDQEAALDAIRQAGTNAVPLLLERALRPESRAELLVSELALGKVGQRLGLRPVTPAGRQAAALVALRRIAPPAGVLLDAAESGLRSTNFGWRRQAMLCVTCAGTERDRIARRLAAELDAAELGNDADLVEAIGWLGETATNCLDRLVARLRPDRWPMPELLLVLGNCGPRAAAAVPRLEAHFTRSLCPPSVRLALAVTLFRVDPAHRGAAAFLRDAATNAANGGAGLRELANRLRHDRVRDLQFAPILEAGLNAGPNRWPVGGYQALEVLQRMAPGAVARFLAERVRSSPTPAEAVAAAGYWIELDPSNQVACTVLLDAARSQGPPALIAIRRLGLAANLPEQGLELLRRGSRDPALPAELRAHLARQLQWRERR